MTLSEYLNDHWAGSTSGVRLAARLARRMAGTEHADELAALARAIEADRDQLLSIMRGIDVTPRRAKQLVGWAAELASRLGLSDLVSRGGLAPLLEMEALGAGIHAKRSLWENLAAVRGGDERLDREQLEALAARAEHQMESLGRVRRAVAGDVLAG